jgi:hypothetical protein
MKSVLWYIVLAGRGNKSESIIAWVDKEVSALSFLQLMTSKYIPNGNMQNSGLRLSDTVCTAPLGPIDLFPHRI